MFFKFLHSLSGSAEPLIVVIVEQNHASGYKAGVEKYKTGQNGGVQVGIQAYQTKALLFQSCRCIRKISPAYDGLFRKGEPPQHSLLAGVREFTFPGKGTSLTFFFFYIPWVKSLECIE